ncbi:MAG TPA: hypothetical protein VLS48_06225 [Anaerolineales bacterium]|nr:hypothetical protein [Anaerolineales bacterium]
MSVNETTPLPGAGGPEAGERKNDSENLTRDDQMVTRPVNAAAETSREQADALSSTAETVAFRPAGGEDAPETGETRPHPAGGPPPVRPVKKRRARWPLFTLLGLLILALIAAASGYAGYQGGIDLRQQAESTQRVGQIQTQFDLAMQELAERQFFRARQRFEYVIQLDPNFPGAQEGLAEALLALNTTATPTVAPTPTLTPTPDMRGVEQLFQAGQEALNNGEWTNAIDTLLNLRKVDPDYNAVQIDGMLYLAFRNRGRDKIVREADLEGGLYDLALAEQFGPLDAEAQGMRTWVSIYITGTSFWEIDWTQVIFYLEQVAPQMPGLQDGSGWTARERYQIALAKLGDQLMDEERWCDALEQYEKALAYNENDPVMQAATERARQSCNRGEPVGEPGEEGGPAPTKEPTPTPFRPDEN